jgi:hypothetical protein
MVNGCRKGKAGEREAAKAWSEATGCDAARGQQHSGSPESPDVKHGIKGVHIEVKRTARGYNTQSAIDQAREDAAQGDVPIAMTRQDRGEWIVSVPLCDLMSLVDKLASRKWMLE